jgi:putative FmdB family regulatory protein
MPIYGYRCRSCGHEFEVLQKMSDQRLKTCPKCSGSLAKIMYPAGVVFKGSGYYTTDYKGAGKAQEQASSNGADKGSDKSPAASSESTAKTDKTSSESKSESKSTKPDSKTEKTS